MSALLESLTNTMHKMQWHEFAGVAVIGGAVRRLIRRKVHAPSNGA